jgi:glycosyltransferase involved in cell wall biosynthesis
MRIVAWTHNLGRSGAPIILFRLLRELRERHAVTVLAPDRPNDPLRAEYEALGIRCSYDVDCKDFDVFLVNTLTGGDQVVRAHRTLPCLWWIHEPRFGLRYAEIGEADMRAFRCAHTVVFPTRWQAEEVYAPWLTRRNWRVVPYGIGLDMVRRPPPFQREPGRFYLLHLGTIDRRKGVDVTCNAVNLIDDPRVKVLFVGAKLRPDLVTRYARPDRFELIGECPEETVSAYLQHCDALVFPTRDDLVTLAILEALQFGLPVLASDFGPIPQTIRHGYTGLVSPVGDPRVLAGNIKALLADPVLSERFRREGPRILQRDHGFEAHVAGMERALEDAIEVARGQRRVTPGVSA